MQLHLLLNMLMAASVDRPARLGAARDPPEMSPRPARLGAALWRALDRLLADLALGDRVFAAPWLSNAPAVLEHLAHRKRDRRR